MKPSLLRLLACPSCKGELRLTEGTSEGAEILEGRLVCVSCTATHPIVRGIPRFVASGEYASSFGRQWHWFRTVQLDSHSGTPQSEDTLRETIGWTPAAYRGRLVLDAGVGAGRFAEVAARYGAEVVGVDLSVAIDAAYENIGRQPNVHLIQADIFALPFSAETFDLAYSVGVLHHTPDTRAAFDRVAATVKKGGSLAVYLYAGYGPAHKASDLFRTVTTRLPSRVMLGLSTLAIPLYYPYRLPVVGKLLNLCFPISLHPDWRWRWLDTFDWYTPRYQWKLLYPEVLRWYRAAGFIDVEVFDEPIRMCGIKNG